MDEILPKPLTDVPLLQGLEQRLVLMRMTLLDSVAFLQLAHDAAVVCAAASKQTDNPCNMEIASVLHNSVTYRVDMQMREISSIVRLLGGANSFTKGHDELLDLFDKVSGQGKYSAGEHYGSAAEIARLYSALGQKRAALDWLEKARDDHDSLVVFLTTTSDFDPVRRDKRFVQLLNTTGRTVSLQ